MNHTPGPWERIHNPPEAQTDAYKRRKYHIYRTEPSGHTEGIADTAAYEWTISPEEHEANARLIAAAPDLLAACKVMLANLDRWLDTGQVATADESKALYDQMVAAVAKAEATS